MGTRCADHVTPLYTQKLALTSPTGGGRSVGIVRVRTKAMELCVTAVYRGLSQWVQLLGHGANRGGIVAPLLVAATDFSFPQSFQTGSGPNQSPIPRVLWDFPLRSGDRGKKLSTRFHLELRLRMSGAVLPLPCMFHGVHRYNLTCAQTLWQHVPKQITIASKIRWQKVLRNTTFSIIFFS